MATEHQHGLITEIVLIGMAVAVLGYLFHPEVGHLTLTIDGQPVADPLIRIAAVPTFLLIAGFVAVLAVMVFFGIGMFIFATSLFAAVTICLLLAPYFWPVMLIVLLPVAAMWAGSRQSRG